MKLPDPKFILLGAGATRAAYQNAALPPPLDFDFFDIASQIAGRGTGVLARRVSKDVFELYNRVSGIGLEQYYRDIETRLELSNFARSANRPKDWEKRRRNLEELVRRVLIHTTCEIDEGPAKVKPSKIHQAIYSRLGASDTIGTFNYDTVIEESFPNAKLWAPRGGYGIQATGVTHEWSSNWYEDRRLDGDEEASIEVLKLHGSINWNLNKATNVVIKQRPYFVRAQRGKPVFGKAAILPPGWHKRVDKNPYNKIWRLARLRLEKCKTLVIVGYSLPDTDLIARALFLEVARLRRARGNLLKELHVADVSEAVKKKIIEIFVPALGSEGTVFQYSSADDLAKRWRTPKS